MARIHYPAGHVEGAGPQVAVVLDPAAAIRPSGVGVVERHHSPEVAQAVLIHLVVAVGEEDLL